MSKTQLFCSNLPWSVNGKVLRARPEVCASHAAAGRAPTSAAAQMLRQAFEEHGEVVDAFVAYNGRSSRGFGYVTFKEPSAAAAAVAVMNGVPLGAR